MVCARVVPKLGYFSLPSWPIFCSAFLTPGRLAVLVCLCKLGGHPEAFWEYILNLFDHLLDSDVENIYLAALGFADDIWLFAYRTSYATIMLAELSFALAEVNLDVQELKLSWMGNKYVCDSACIYFKGNAV